MKRGCPFHPQTGGIGLSDLAGIVRCGDRVRLSNALDQLDRSLARTEDLDEARGEALTFIAMVTAATLEMGGSRAMHRVQLDAAREMDLMESRQEIAEASRRIVEAIVRPLTDPTLTLTQMLIDRALQIIEKHYHKDLTDEMVARDIGLSTSHFRHLFKEATGQPFRKYLMAVRLEHARRMILEGDAPISEIALDVGFTGLAHFSRAFTQRFAVSPSSLRRGGMAMGARS